MDYKEKYEQALERAKYYHDRDNIQFLENIFPELKESEDERIRKQTLKVLNYYKDEEKSEGRMPTEIEECIAWLEKQGKQKQDVSIQINPSKYINDMGGNGCYLKNVTQASAWSEEDVAMLDSAIAFVEHSAFTTIGKGKNNVIAWLKSIKDKVQPQPQPRQELSEEDKRIIDNLISQLGNLFARKLIKEETKVKYVNWLKSLRPQPKQEWSQNDIEMIDWLIRSCEKEHEELCNDKYGHQDIVSDLKMDCRKKWDWLESLKNRVIPKNQWKPSERQKEALLWCVVHLGGADKQTLGELLEELNKL